MPSRAVPAGLDPDGSGTLANLDASLLGRDFAGAERAVEAAIHSERREIKRHCHGTFAGSSLPQWVLTTWARSGIVAALESITSLISAG